MWSYRTPLIMLIVEFRIIYKCWPCIPISFNTCLFKLVLKCTPNHTPLKYRCSFKIIYKLGTSTLTSLTASPLDLLIIEIDNLDRVCGREKAITCESHPFPQSQNPTSCTKWLWWWIKSEGPCYSGNNKGELPCRPLAHQILVGIRTNLDGIWWGGVRLCQPTIVISGV